MSRDGSQYYDQEWWLAYGASRYWAPRQFVDTDGTWKKGEWQQCEQCSMWLFHSPNAKDHHRNVGGLLTLSHRPDGGFFCAPCFGAVVVEAGEFCHTCLTGTQAPSHEQEYGADYDEYGEWHCSDCWDEYRETSAYSYDANEDDEEEAEYEGEEAEGEDGSWCCKCDTFFPGEYADFGWQDFVCAECTDESTSRTVAKAAVNDTEALSKHEKNEVDVSIISQLTVVSRLGLCPFYVYWTHARGRDESCDGRCGLVHESPGSAALGELMFADPPKLYCCSGANPPCLEPANLQRATGYSSAAEWIESLPWCALPARQRPAPSPTPTIPSPPPPPPPPTPHRRAIWAISICKSRHSTAIWACPLPAARSDNVGLQSGSHYGGSSW